MLKLLGSICVAAAGGWMLWKLLAEERRKTELLRELAAALETMSDEIRLNRTPMARLLLRAGMGRSSEIMDFFAAVQMSSGEVGLPEAWRLAAVELPLPEREKAAFSELGSCLTGDEERACRGLSAMTAQLQKELERQRDSLPERSRRSAALCLSGAALVVILLI